MDVTKINGYDINDAQARKLATSLYVTVDAINQQVNKKIVPDVDSLKSKADKAEYDITDLRGQCSDLLNDVEVLEDRMNNLPTTDANGNVTTLGWDSITGKPETFPPETHTHTAEEVGAKPSDYVPTWDEITGKPEKFPPETHAHSISWSSVIGKPETFPPETHTHDYATMSQVNEAITAALNNIQNASGVSF